MPSALNAPSTVERGLASFRDHRLAYGGYGRHPGVLGHVVPKGPLHLTRSTAGGSGDNLENEFAFLTVLTPGVLGPGYGMKVRVLPRAQSPRLLEDGKVGFIPLAEQCEDLRFIPKTAGGAFLDVVPADEAALAARAVQALRELAAAGVHIALFPELCVGPTARQAIRESLRSMGRTSLELVVLGSGISDQPAPHDRHYNECVVVNGRGAELWRQRKMNGYEMATATMTACDIDQAVANADHREWTRTDRTLELVDSHDAHRLLVLICEDLEQDTPSRAACRLLRPDWVFTPVLDGSLLVGRWTHRRGWDLAQKFGQRVVVANSMTLHARARRKKVRLRKQCGIGLCVDSREPRRYHIATVSLAQPSPAYNVVDWTPATWPEVEVAKRRPRRAKV